MSTCTSQARLTFLLALCLLGTLSWGLPPTITSFTPTRGLVGTVVTIHGTNLFEAPSSTTVKCNGVVSPVDTQTLTMVIGAGATTGKLSVTTPGGTATSIVAFTVLQPPVITAVTPNSGFAGQVINIYGTDLLEITALKLNGVSIPYTVVKVGKQISFKIPHNMTSGPITISTVLAGTATSSIPFVIDTPAPPTITSFTPIAGKLGRNEMITGKNFTSAQKVFFAGVQSFQYHNDPQNYYHQQAAFSVVDDNTISAFVPQDALDGPITVITAGGTVVSTAFFTRLIPPEMYSISNEPYYYIGTTVTIFGKYFNGVTSVTFSGMPATFTVIDSMTLTAKIPFGAKSGAIVITSPGGSYKTSDYYLTITPLAHIGPVKLFAKIGEILTIPGTGFTGAKKIKFNGVDATSFTVLNNTTMTVKVPFGATTGYITIVASDGSTNNSLETIFISNEAVNGTDDANMIYIPAGKFELYSATVGANGYVHTRVNIDGYWIYQKEVTVAQYRAFCTATNRAMPSAPLWGWQDTNPIINVSWNDAKAYADWAGVQLPTEAQWAKADIGSRENYDRGYPWCEIAWNGIYSWDVTKCANSYNSNNVNGHTGTWPVGSFPAGASPYGLLDMSGNAAEWCSDWYDYNYIGITGPVAGEAKVIRGGSWLDTEKSLTTWARTYKVPSYASNTVGFRCVSTRPAP
ncbi:MAG: SUMF1/EgtB/PvdO family nonheme iron enzyme [bacterium]